MACLLLLLSACIKYRKTRRKHLTTSPAQLILPSVDSRALVLSGESIKDSQPPMPGVKKAFLNLTSYTEYLIMLQKLPTI